MKIVTLFVLVFIVVAHTEAAEINDVVKRSGSCPSGWSLFKGHCFRYIPTPMSWAKAERNCVSMQATLASVRNFEEYHHIQDMIKAATFQLKEAWIGGSDAQEEGIWLWTDGSPFQYINWCPGEPNNQQSQHCLQMNHGGGKCWDDLACYFHRPSVCSKKT